MTVHYIRHRLGLSAAVLLVVALGLASRAHPALFPAFLGKYPGDALWALMVFLGWAIVMPASSVWRLALYALATSFAVEFSQLYKAPWLDGMRATTAGHLVLGSTFAWGDLCAYAVGTAAGVGVVRISVRRPALQAA